MPAVSVIVPTYNMSAALRCALESVRQQTFQDFEVLVIGDGCTDDSGAVVAAFDERFHWENLPRNAGSQWAPNNRGLERARGRFVAYLGHDDLWHPRHLQSMVDTAERRQAALIAAVAIVYGPPGSGIRAVTGVAEGDCLGADDVMPPSSIMHLRGIAAEIGGWRDPADTVWPTDIDFVKRLHQSGARAHATGEPTVFKFAALWRRDVYRLKSSAEQEAMLARLHEARLGESELLDVVRAALAGRLERLTLPKTPEAPPLQQARLRRRTTGLETSEPIRRLSAGAVRIGADQFVAPFEWQGLETDPRFGPFRWNGPLHEAMVDLPVELDCRGVVTIHVVHVVHPDALDRLSLTLNGRPVTFTISGTDAGTLSLRFAVETEWRRDGDRSLRIGLRQSQLWQPAELGLNEDRRRIGVAVNWIEIAPVE